MDLHLLLACRAIQVREIDAHCCPLGFEKRFDAACVKDMVFAHPKAGSIGEAGKADTARIVSRAGNLSLECRSCIARTAVWMQTRQAYGLPANSITLVSTAMHLIAVVPALVLGYFWLLRPSVSGFSFTRDCSSPALLSFLVAPETTKVSLGSALLFIHHLFVLFFIRSSMHAA